MRKALSIACAAAMIALMPAAAHAAQEEFPGSMDVPGNEVIDAQADEEAAANADNDDYWTIPVDDHGKPFQGGTIRKCEDAGKTFYGVSKKHYQKGLGLGMVFRNGPGGTVTASIQGNLTAKASIGNPSGRTQGVPLALIVSLAKSAWKLNVELSAHIQATWQYSFTVPKGEYHSLQFVNWARRSSYTQDYVNQDCSVKRRVGNINFLPVTDNFGYTHWKS